jgi:hypothetical protein
MKPCEIKVGFTYVNRGAGRTRRKVVDIGPTQRPKIWFGDPDKQPSAVEDGVLYEQNGILKRLYLSSFAQWCGAVVVVGH